MKRSGLVLLTAIALSATACEREEAFNHGQEENTERPKPGVELTPARPGQVDEDAAAEAKPKFGQEGGAEMATSTPVDQLREIEHKLKSVHELLTHVEAEPLALSEQQTQRMTSVKIEAMEALERLEERIQELKKIAEEAEQAKPGPSI